MLFEPTLRANTLHVNLNTRHPFYEHVYDNIMKRSSMKASDAVKLIDLLILAYSRAEMSMSPKAAQMHAARLRKLWSDVLNSYFG